MSDRHIFLTGANGFIGRNLIRHFVAQGHRVTGLVRSRNGAQQIAALGAAPVIGDMLTADLAPLMQGCGQLIHAAADLDHGPGKTAANVNANGTGRVFKAAQDAGITDAVHISSDSVLQDGRPLRNVNETHPFPRKPAGAYSAGKAAAERIAIQAATNGMRVIVLRPRMVWGRDDGTALPTLSKAVQDGKFAWISGGNYPSSTTHIVNLCHAVELSFAQGKAGEIYHISDGPARSFRDTVTGLLATQGLTAKDASVPRPLIRVIAKMGDGIYRLTGGRLRGPLSFQEYATSAVEVSLDISKAQQELGFRPVITFDEGLVELTSGNWPDRQKRAS